MAASIVAMALIAPVASCGPSADEPGRVANKSAVVSDTGPPPVDYTVWRDVDASNQVDSLTSMCAGALEGLEAADPSLKDRVALQVPWSVQATRHGKVEAQCIWTGPDGRSGRLVVEVLCSNGDSDRCYRFEYAAEGSRTIKAVEIVHHPQPPISRAFPPGADDVERDRSNQLLAWARDHGPDQEGALRVTFRNAKVGIVASAKIPFLCGDVGGGGPSHHFVVWSIGAAATPPSPTFYWSRKPSDVSDFCNTAQGDLQWYAVPDSALNGT